MTDELTLYAIPEATGSLTAEEAQTLINQSVSAGGFLGSLSSLRIESNGLNVGSTGHIRGGQTDYNSGTGFFLGYSGGNPSFSVGIGGSTSNNLTFTNGVLTINGYIVSGKGAFGGDGSDGAIAITSGTTTISAASARTVIKNYSSISITGTGALTFSTPHANGTLILLKSQGNVTLTSSAAPMLSASAMGSAGGAAVTTTGAAVDGNNGTDTTRAHFIHYSNGAGGGALGASAGAAGTAPSLGMGTSIADSMFLRYNELQCGAGGGSGGAQSGGGGNAVSGRGGNGGGALIVECAGAWNFTTASGISVAGEDGQDGSHTAANYIYVDGAAGGGGFFFALYNTLTASSGTVNVAGGTGTLALHKVGFGGTQYGAGSGSSPISVGTAGTSGTTNGNTVSATGPSGYSFINKNYLYA